MFSNVNFDAMIPEWFKSIVTAGNDLIWTEFFNRITITRWVLL